MILTLCHWWIVGLWMAFVVYWAAAAIRMKRGPGFRAFRSGMRMRLLLIVVIVLAVELSRRWTMLHDLQVAEFFSVPMALSGAIIATAGAALAFAARATIGANWGAPAMQRTDTDLVTTGPYALIRHPIYSGVLLMMIGTAMGLVLTWWLVSIAAAIYFVTSARAEERFMVDRFPDTYPAYRARTKMLVPFVL